MRLWLRLTLIMGALTLFPLAIVGVLATETARENATLRPEEAMSRNAAALATFVGSWVDGQARMLGGWGSVWDLSTRGDDYRINLLRATWLAMDATVTVALTDADGQPVVPAQFQRPGVAPGNREAGTDARASALFTHAPKRIDAVGYQVGTPYAAPGGLAPVVPIAAATGEGGLRLLAELSLAPVLEVFAQRPDVAAVLLDGFGQPVIGGEHPLLVGEDVDALLDQGIDRPFTTEHDGALLQGALFSVPHTDWKVLVLAPPSLSAEQASVVRWSTLKVGTLALMVVAAVGFAIERTLTRSVEELRAHAGAVTRGVFEDRNRVDRGDEIGDLGLALNVMSQQLEASEAELRAWNVELQDRVEARTRQLEAAQAQLVRAGQLAAVAEIGAGLAHELNNPLSAILGQVQLAAAQGGEASGTALARIEAQAQRCREVVDSMLRLSAGKVERQATEPIDLSLVLGETLHAVKPLFDRRGVSLDVVIPDHRLPSRIERGSAQRVLSRMLESLCAGLEDGARLRVEATRGPQVRIALVADRPVGIAGARDDWRSAGVRFWTARGLLELAGGHVEEEQGREGSWVAVFPEAT